MKGHSIVKDGWWRNYPFFLKRRIMSNSRRATKLPVTSRVVVNGSPFFTTVTIVVV